MTDTTQLQALAKRVPDRYISQRTTGGGFKADYVGHADIQQMLLAKLGPCSQKIIELIFSPDGVVEGVVLEMMFLIDGMAYVVQEIGECEHPTQTDKKTGKVTFHNGINAKNAVSDGVKRCAMRVGLGLELWSQDNYVLDKALAPSTKEKTDES